MSMSFIEKSIFTLVVYDKCASSVSV